MMKIYGTFMRKEDMKIKCYGDFYDLQFGGETYQCRSTLEIFRSMRNLNNPDRLLDCTPDIVVIMMNPGSSRPCEDIPPRQLDSSGDIASCPRLILTVPDIAQYQIMRIMDEKDLQHVRVLNLSDIRMSSHFLENFPGGGCAVPGHSIFCPERYAEFQCRLNSRLNIIIAGWGKVWGNADTITGQHAEHCHNQITATGMTILGMRDHDKKHLYGYPFQSMNPVETFNWLNHVLTEWPED